MNVVQVINNGQHYKRLNSINIKGMRSLRANNNSSRNTDRSLNSSVTFSNAPQSKYPKCEVKKQHQKDPLNLVCLTPNCKGKGVICSMCKAEQHSKHNVIPVKTFLQKVRESYKIKKQEQMMEKNEDTKKERSSVIIQKIKNEMLSVLSFYVSSVAEQIQLLEQKIIKQCDEMSIRIEEQEHLKENLSAVVEDLLENIPDENTLYRKQMNTILQIMQVKSDTRFQLSCNFQQKVAVLKKKSQNFKLNIEKWVSHSMNDFNHIFNESVNPRPGTAVQSTAKFLPDLKAKGITLSEENKVAKQTNYNNGKIALLNMTNIKQKSVTIKMLSINTNIGLGVCLKDIVKANSYKLNQASLGHGTFLLAKNSYQYSHSEKVENMTMKGFSFTTGDEISITVKGNQLSFRKKGDPKAVATLSLKNINEEQWKQLHFCVCLNGNGDKVEIGQNF